MVQVGLKTDRGLKRRNNEDALFVVPEDKVYMVADGLGGYNSGEVASRETVSILAEYVKTKPIGELVGKENICNYIVDAVKYANSRIWELAHSKEEYKSMATTLVFVYINIKKAYIASVGDSRAYLYRDKNLVQITEDDSIVADMVRSGQLDASDAKNHPDINKLTRAIGAEPEVVPNVYEIRLKTDDVLMLCTDGLYGELDSHEIISILDANENMSEMCTNLVTEANRAGGHDNITVVCLKI